MYSWKLSETQSCPDTLYACCVVIYNSFINNKYYYESRRFQQENGVAL